MKKLLKSLACLMACLCLTLTVVNVPETDVNEEVGTYSILDWLINGN